MKVEATKRTRLLNSLQDVPNQTAVPIFGELAEEFLACAEANLAKATVVLHRVNSDTRLKKAHAGGNEDIFPDDPFTMYTFRYSHGTRHSQAGTELAVLAELMGLRNIQTTMICVRAARK